MTALIFALGLSMSDTPQSCPYEPKPVIHLKASPQEIETAKKRNELATLLIQALKDEANRTIDRKREARIQRLLRELTVKE